MVSFADTILQWWIIYHRPIITKLIGDTGKKIRYYGGFALNLALGSIGSSVPEPNWLLLGSYRDGLHLTSHAASDIDAKILDSPHPDYNIVREFLINGSGGTTVASLDRAAAQAAIHAAGVSAAELFVIDAPADDAPIQYVVGYSKFYITHGKGHHQLILIGLYQNDSEEWETQVLSELTPSSEKAPANSPVFTNTDIPTLRAQFAELLAFLEARAGRHQERKLKTRARIAAINAKLTKNASAKKGGARQRSRGRQTRRLRKKREVPNYS